VVRSGAAQAPLRGAGVDAVLSALALVYAGAAAWHHRRPAQKQGVCFAPALLLLGATLTGPLRLALERLFVAYIFQQFVALMIAAPLVLLGLPGWMARAVFMNRVIQPAWRFATKPVTALLLFSAIFAFIHYPTVCERVCHLRPVYYSIRFLLVLLGLMLWWPVLSPLTELPRLPYPAQILYLFVIMILITATAAPITMARSRREPAADNKMASATTKELGRQLGGVCMLAALSLACGLALNRFRAAPLPLLYRTPEQRLERQLAELVKNPPFQVTDQETIGLQDFQRALADRRTVVLDARASPFYKEGHVPGALNLSREEFARDYQHLSATLGDAKERPIIVYCSGGSCHDSKLVAGALLSLGFANVKVFAGGWEVWKDAGLPVSHQP
jgi:cytochrome c oxidase assembly factor CtaG/rhodanese-related sulfurtransferase